MKKELTVGMVVASSQDVIWIVSINGELQGFQVLKEELRGFDTEIHMAVLDDIDYSRYDLVTQSSKGEFVCDINRANVQEFVALAKNHLDVWDYTVRVETKHYLGQINTRMEMLDISIRYSPPEVRVGWSELEVTYCFVNRFLLFRDSHGMRWTISDPAIIGDLLPHLILSQPKEIRDKTIEFLASI